MKAKAPKSDRICNACKKRVKVKGDVLCKKCIKSRTAWEEAMALMAEQFKKQKVRRG